MDIKKLIENYKTYEELTFFVESQFKQILNLTKKIKELEDQNTKLKTEKKLAVVPNDAPVPGTTPNLKVLDDAKTVSQVQLRMLKDIAFERELTLEETKKLEIFNKILNQAVDKDKPLKVDAKVLKDDDLIKLIENS